MGIINLSVSSSTTCFKGVVHAMWLCVLVLLCISATYGRGLVDILRLDERDDYMSDVEVTDEGVACDSCCEVPEDDTCGGILNKLDEIKVVIGNICTGDEPEKDDGAMVKCVQEITGVLVEDPAETLQVCKCQ